MNILFISAIALLLIVFALFSYPRIILLYIKTTRGCYSHSFLSRYKKYFNKNPYGYCVKEDFIDRIIPFIKKKEGIVEVNLSENRLPLNHPWFIQFKKLRALEGKPSCFQAYHKYGIDFKIIGYKTSIHDTKAKVFYYFADRLLFMTEYIVSDNSGKKATEMIRFLSDGKDIDTGNVKYLYLRINEHESLFFRDAAFSLIISCLNSNHSHIRSCLNTIGEEHKRLWQNLEKK